MNNLTEVIAKVRCNNQITVGLQNVVRRFSHVNRPLSLERESGSLLSEGDLDAVRTNFGNYRLNQKWEETVATNAARLSGNWGKYLKVPPLDITEKFQRGLRGYKNYRLFCAVVSVCVAIIDCDGRYRVPTPRKLKAVAGQKLRECGAAMDIVAGDRLECCVVTTLTLPASTVGAYKALSAYSGYACNRLFQVLRRNLGKDVYWFYVWEYQKRGALHLHICHYHPDSTESLYAGQMLVEQWHEVLLSIGELSGVDMFAKVVSGVGMSTIRQYHQHHYQPLRKSCGGYFSKYAGKGNDEERVKWKFPPLRFWGCSRNLNVVRKENSIDLNLDYGSSEMASNKVMELLNYLNENAVPYSQFSFRVNIPDSQRKGFEKCIAEGFRFVFYCAKEKLLEVMRTLDMAFCF